MRHSVSICRVTYGFQISRWPVAPTERPSCALAQHIGFRAFRPPCPWCYRPHCTPRRAPVKECPDCSGGNLPNRWPCRAALDAHPVAEYKNSIMAAGGHSYARVQGCAGVKDGQGEAQGHGPDTMLRLRRDGRQCVGDLPAHCRVSSGEYASSQSRGRGGPRVQAGQEQVAAIRRRVARATEDRQRARRRAARLDAVG